MPRKKYSKDYFHFVLTVDDLRILMKHFEKDLGRKNVFLTAIPDKFGVAKQNPCRYGRVLTYDRSWWSE